MEKLINKEEMQAADEFHAFYGRLEPELQKKLEVLIWWKQLEEKLNKAEN